MNIILDSNKKILEMLGPNVMDPSKRHRLLKYLLIEDVDNGKAIYNELTRSFVWIPNIHFGEIYGDRSMGFIDYLWTNYFLVNEDFDEWSVQWELKEKMAPKFNEETYLKNGTIESYTIFSTMACNARCEYCYEQGRPQRPMKAETARQAGDYIIKSAVKNGRTIALHWFGGEPLVNENAIDIICQKLKDTGFNYKSSFTSNGFLFKKEKLEKYRDLWHIDYAQITLDGTEEFYNKIKNYKNVKGKSPYKVVLDNIEFLSKDLNIYISVRINMTLDNAENIKELIKELYNRFKGNKRVNPYCYPVFDTDNPRTTEENEYIFKKLKEVEDIMHQYGYANGQFRNGSICATHCMCDSAHAVVISPEGDLGLCEHYSEDNFWGHINKPEMRDSEMIKSFKEYVKDQDICKKCPIQPSCTIPLKCHDLRYCNLWKQEWRVREAHTDVKFMYNQYINNRNNNNQKNSCNNNCNNNCNNQNKQNNNQNNIINKQENKKNIILTFFENILIFLGIK